MQICLNHIDYIYNGNDTQRHTNTQGSDTLHQVHNMHNLLGVHKNGQEISKFTKANKFDGWYS